jgi:hypothetical protein
MALCSAAACSPGRSVRASARTCSQKIWLHRRNACRNASSWIPWCTRRAAAVEERSSSSALSAVPSRTLVSSDLALSTETVRTSSSSASSAVA